MSTPDGPKPARKPRPAAKPPAKGEQLQRLENEGRRGDEQGRDSEADPNARE